MSRRSPLSIPLLSAVVVGCWLAAALLFGGAEALAQDAGDAAAAASDLGVVITEGGVIPLDAANRGEAGPEGGTSGPGPGVPGSVVPTTGSSTLKSPDGCTCSAGSSGNGATGPALLLGALLLLSRCRRRRKTPR